MVRLLSFIFMAFIFSCTIIEDSDITSQEELDNLKFTAIEITQEANLGRSTIVAKVTKNTAVNISFVAGNLPQKVTRQLWMDWPALGTGSKLKLKSGFTGSFKSYASFLESGKPWTFYLFNSDSVIFELYSFRYDAAGKLNKIITRAPAVVGTPVSVLAMPATSNDTLIYGNPNNTFEVTSIIRRSQDASKAGTISVTAGSFLNPHAFNFKGRKYEKPDLNGTSFYSFGTTAGLNDGLVELAGYAKESLRLIDHNNNPSSCQCSKWIDTFYFHPLMLLKEQLPQAQFENEKKLGDALLYIYMIDWWQPISTQESSNNETVTFTYKYGL